MISDAEVIADGIGFPVSKSVIPLPNDGAAGGGGIINVDPGSEGFVAKALREAGAVSSGQWIFAETIGSCVAGSKVPYRRALRS
eukprot:7713923-Karenia_brevis.AAC.1